MPPHHSPPLRLLVVDDIENNRTLLSRRFVKRGFDVVEAECGLTALDLIAEQAFDIVLLDIMMPGIDGFEVLRRIRLTHTPDDLPVVMVTARAGNTDIVQALELGANDYITKPIDFSIAFARIQTQLARGQAQKALAKSVAQLVGINRQLEQEIAERKRSEDRVRHMTHHDALTGLGNRVLFRDELRRALQHVDRDGPLAVLFVDLAGFKLINDTLGHTAGDVLLATVADRLRDCVQGHGVVTRVGSDEFAIIRTGLAETDNAGRLAETVARSIAVPCTIDGHDVVPGCRIGITLASVDRFEPDVLLGQAHMAMHRARHDGGSIWRFFEAGMDERAQARRALESDLRKAVSAKQFELHYQPLYDLATNAISGFEALLRWRHPVRGMVSPADFIPLTEEIGLIVPIGEWVLQQACRDAMQWPAGIKVAVNVSSVQFRDAALIQTVTAALATSGLSADRLEVEITESLLLDSNAATLDMLHHLRGMGIRISMDDFGTGYSSLSYLRKFPFDKLKIDQSFTRELDGTRDSVAIVHAILELAASLGMVTTAEGVETQAQLDWLRKEGCNEAQGYLMSRPVPAQEIAALFENGRLTRKVA